jgi:predicted anti-sigma-YlaC factor YlaD
MKCNEAQDYMMKFFDKNINDIEEAQLRQHMKNCTQCSEEFSSLKEIFSEIEQDSSIEPPKDFELQVMSRIEKEAAMYTKPVHENAFVYNILLVAVSFIFVILFGGILYEAVNHPIALIQNVQIGTDLVKEFFSAAVTMAKGIGLAVMGVTASVYKTYYYAYILLGILLLLIQGVFIRMVRGGNGAVQ